MNDGRTFGKDIEHAEEVTVDELALLDVRRVDICTYGAIGRHF